VRQVQIYNQHQFKCNSQQIKQHVEQLLAEYQVDQVQVEISLVNLAEIKQLNQTEMGREGATDVLSFPQESNLQNLKSQAQASTQSQYAAQFPTPEGELQTLGDIVVSYPIAQQAAKRSGKSVTDQLCFYIEHGLLHLLGYHHR
jgi:probable rRNA maturation factor